MTIVNPLSSPALVPQVASSQITTPEERQVDLRLEQIVRATVVEGGLDRTLLELNHRHYRAQGDLELQVGQKLTLQVLQTHPRLEFRVLAEPLGGRLNQLLPLLARPFDWPQLVNQLQQLNPQQLPTADRQVFQQLLQILQPAGPLPAGLGSEIVRLTGLLQQLAPGESAVTEPEFFFPQTGRAELQTGLFAAGRPTTSGIAPLLRELQQQLLQLPKNQAQPLPQGWVGATRNLWLTLPQQVSQLQQLPPVQLQQLTTLLGQLQQIPQLPPQLSGELAGQLLRLNIAQSSPSPAAIAQASPQQSAAAPAGQSQPQFIPSSPAAPAGSQSQPQAALPGGVPEPHRSGTAPVGNLTPAPATAVVTPAGAKELGADLEQLLSQVRQLQAEKGGLPADLGGRLEALLGKLQQVPQPQAAGTPLLPGLELLSGQLAQLVQQGGMRPEGGQLGFLSQLFGFHLETELLNGKKRDALSSLKLSLLDLREELGKRGDEPLQRLETLQLCKAKLADEQVQFLPLPFPELEEGYLFVEKQRDGEAGQESDPPLQLSISLRVSALGNMRIDMLYDQQGLHLRVACEDKEKMRYLQSCSAELAEAIETVPLQGVSFAADAQVPTRKLQERLQPGTLNMLDARI